jgi:tetratricopeptide (TPR) repeat protein
MLCLAIVPLAVHAAEPARPPAASVNEPPKVSSSQAPGQSDADAAIGELEERLKQDPLDPALPSRLAAAYMERARRTADFRDYSRADETLTQALKRDPRNYSAWVSLASCQMAQHRFADAFESADKALGIRRDGREALALRGDAQFQFGSIARAGEDYVKLLASDPQDMLTHVRMSQLRFAQGDANAAAESLETAIRSGEERAAPPGLMAWVVLRRGELYFRTGDYDEAEKYYTRSLQITPDDPETLDHLAELHAARGDFDTALEYSAKSIAQSPRPEFYQSRGDVLTARGTEEAAAEAFKCYETALAKYLKAAEAGHGLYYHHLVGFYCDVDAFRDPNEAMRWARRDLQLRNSVAALEGMAWAVYQSGDIKEAAEWMDKAMRDTTLDSHILHHAGLIYSRAGDRKKGLAYLRRAATINPKFNEFHFHR